MILPELLSIFESLRIEISQSINMQINHINRIPKAVLGQ